MGYLYFTDLIWGLAKDTNVGPYAARYCAFRFKNEGVKFLTCTLPKISKAVLYSIERGRFSYHSSGLTTFARKGCFPRIFHGLLSKVFTSEGVLRLPMSSDGIEAVRNIRQFCEYWYKLGLDFEPDVLVDAERKYLANQEYLKGSKLDVSWVERLRKISETHFPQLHRATTAEILSVGPRFGPGAFAGHKSFERVFGLPFYAYKATRKASLSYPKGFEAYSGFFKPYPGFSSTASDIYEGTYPNTGVRKHKVRRPKLQPVKSGRRATVAFVKKDSRGPRVISMEPLQNLRVQMAFFDWIAPLLERETANRVNFYDQSINKELARSGSISRDNATLDLKDASDRVSYRLASVLFKHACGIRELISKARSTTFILPSGIEGTQYSLAGMGSGFTFPILAYVIYLSVSAQVSLETGLPIKEVFRHVYVYGDDLIIPRRWYAAAKRGLERSDLAVNSDKSFANGPFRESCGGDYLCGEPVSPVRFRLAFSPLPSPKEVGPGLCLSFDETRTLVPLIEHGNELKKNGLWHTSRVIFSKLRKVLPLPYIGEGSSVLGEIVFNNQLILDQAERPSLEAPDGVIPCSYTQIPTEVDFVKQCCPYTYVGRQLRQKSLTPLEMLLGNSCGPSFGALSVPRKIKLVKRTDLSVVAALGAATLLSQW